MCIFVYMRTCKRRIGKYHSTHTVHSAATHDMIHVIIDYRERGLLACLQASQTTHPTEGVVVRHANLELGDIHIVIHDKKGAVQRTLIYERKSLADMISSITDGRYREQKIRMLATYEARNIAYIVEGDSIVQSLSRENPSVSSAYLNMVYRDNLHLFFTADVCETALFILSVCKKIIAVPKNYLATGGGLATADIATYTAHVKIKSKKSHNITPENCFILQLSQVPTISHVVAKKIAHIFPNMPTLISAVLKCTSLPEKVALLSSVAMVGSEKATKLLKYMQLM